MIFARATGTAEDDAVKHSGIIYFLEIFQMLYLQPTSEFVSKPYRKISFKKCFSIETEDCFKASDLFVMPHFQHAAHMRPLMSAQHRPGRFRPASAIAGR
jgi:hypothetical protein